MPRSAQVPQICAKPWLTVRELAAFLGTTESGAYWFARRRACRKSFGGRLICLADVLLSLEREVRTANVTGSAGVSSRGKSKNQTKGNHDEHIEIIELLKYSIKLIIHKMRNLTSSNQIIPCSN